MEPSSIFSDEYLAIDIDGVTCRYRRKVVLDGLDLQIKRGELVGILGPNGAGKTTLLHVITGYMPISAGVVRIMGRPLETLDTRQRARLISLLPQILDTPFPYPVVEIVAMGRYIQGETAEEQRARAMMALEDCGIGYLANRIFSRLSGGERQLVLLARCLCQDSPILLLDEATASLDIKRKIQVFEILAREVRERGRTVVTVIHDINLASLYLDSLIFIKNGSVVGQGKVQDILTQECLSMVFETRTLVISHPECDRPAVLFSPGK